MPLQVAIAEERKRSINKYESRLTRLVGIMSLIIFCNIYFNDRLQKPISVISQRLERYLIKVEVTYHLGIS